MTTLAKVAQRAGVSIATVSKVLSNTPYFTEETRLKVMQAVEELGYVPNLAGRALSTGKTHIIAIVFPRIYDSFSKDPFSHYVMEGIEEECQARGYNILLSTPRMSASGPDSHYQRLIKSGYLDGMIAFDNIPNVSVVIPARERHIPAVSIGYGDQYFVRSDDRIGGRLIMEHVLGLGHRQIGILTVPPELHLCIPERMSGFAEVADLYEVDFGAFVQLDGDFSIESGAQGTAKLLETQPTTTAIVCINDRMALGAIQELHRRKIRVPDEISVVGYDNIPMSELFAPSLTTIDQDGPTLGRIAAQMLFELMNNEVPDSVMMPPELLVRHSSTVPRHS